MGKMNHAEPDAKCSQCGDPLEEGDLCGSCQNHLGYADPLSRLIEDLIDDKLKLETDGRFLNRYARERYETNIDRVKNEIDRRFPNVY